MESVPTKERLARALEEAGAPAEMVARARRGMYDDYESPLATPIAALVHEARLAGLHAIADRAVHGEFDANAAESDAWWEREGKHLVPPRMRPLFERDQSRTRGG